jgi:large subunit ribosomal protein L13
MNQVPKELLLDAKNQIMGRLASYVAKRAILGDTVIILNAEKAIISGRRPNIVEEAKHKLHTRTLGTQIHSPVHPRRPDLYLRRVVRGMLPWKESKGRTAYHRVHVYVGVPEQYAGKETYKPAGADGSRLCSPFMSLEELATEIGG